MVCRLVSVGQSLSLRPVVGLSRLPSQSLSPTWTFLFVVGFAPMVEFDTTRAKLSEPPFRDDVKVPAFPRWRHRRCVLSCLHRLWRTFRVGYIYVVENLQSGTAGNRTLLRSRCLGFVVSIHALSSSPRVQQPQPAILSTMASVP